MYISLKQDRRVEYALKPCLEAASPFNFNSTSFGNGKQGKLAGSHSNGITIPSQSLCASAMFCLAMYPLKISRELRTKANEINQQQSQFGIQRRILISIQMLFSSVYSLRHAHAGEICRERPASEEYVVTSSTKGKRKDKSNVKRRNKVGSLLQFSGRLTMFILGKLHSFPSCS
jgi:hypothetical protein